MEAAVLREREEVASSLTGIMDVDGHEMAPTHLWGPLFGAASAKLAVIAEPMMKKSSSNDFYNPGVNADEREITDDTVWRQKGTSAPSAFDFGRRTDAMDIMGIERQLVFPSYAIFAMQLYEEGRLPPGSSRFSHVKPQDTGLTQEELGELGGQGVDEYNEWAIRATARNPDRLRMVASLKPLDTVDEMVAQARDWIDRGIRAVQLMYGSPLGGRSPAHPDLDPFWALLAERNVACTLHIGAEQGFRSTDEWRNAPAFALGKIESHEVGMEPYSFAILHQCVGNWITCMVLGGVFERHPDLRFGALELGSAWLGPLADNLDLYGGVFARRLAPFLKMKPSDYIARNIRVTPFNAFERVEDYFTSHPHLSSCYSYSSDYPHVEGGIDSKVSAYNRIAHLGDAIVEKFFVTNGEWLLPA